MSQQNRFFLRRPFKYQFTNITLGIILVNCIIYALCYFSPRFFYYANYYGSLNPIMIIKGKMYWQFLTYMFLHSNLSHLIANMFGLLIFGIQVEKRIGSKEFLLYYLLCGIFSGVCSFITYYFTGHFRVFLLGASGAVYSILFAYAVCFPRSVIYIWGILPLPAPLMVIIYAIIEFGSQFLGRSSNVSHMTHLYGFLSAYLYFLIRMGIHPIKIWKNTYN